MKILSILFAHFIVRVWPVVIFVDCLIAFYIWKDTADLNHAIFIFIGSFIPISLIVSPMCKRLLRWIIIPYAERANAIMESASELIKPDRTENRELIRYMFSFVDASGQKHEKHFLEIRYGLYRYNIPRHPIRGYTTPN